MAVNSFREDEYMENTDKKKILRRLLSYLLDYKLAYILKDRMGKDYEITKFEERQENRENFEDEEEEYE